MTLYRIAQRGGTIHTREAKKNPATMAFVFLHRGQERRQSAAHGEGYPPDGTWSI